MITTSLLRLRRVLVRYGPAIAAVLLVVGAVALGGAWWIFANPPTTEVTTYTNEETIRSSLGTQDIVSEETQLYETGTTLRNQPVYLQSITPIVTLVHRTTVPSNQSVQVSQRMVLVLEATHEGDVFWQSNQTLAQTNTTTRSGEVISRAPLNITKLEHRLAQRKETIEDAGSLRASIRVRVSYDTGQYTGSFTKRAPLTLQEDWYVTPTTSTTRTRRASVVQTTTVPRDASSYLVPSSVGVIAVLLSAGIAGAWRYRLQDEDLNELQYRINRHVHSDWISEGSLDGVNAKRCISVQTLEDLVDIAIDTDKRVIHDRSQDVFAVVDEAAVYYYDESDEAGWEWQGDLFGQQR